MKYSVGTFRDAGVQARWSKMRSGRPIIVVRDNGSTGQWWYVTSGMFDLMKEHGIRNVLDGIGITGPYFSVKG